MVGHLHRGEAPRHHIGGTQLADVNLLPVLPGNQHGVGRQVVLDGGGHRGLAGLPVGIPPVLEVVVAEKAAQPHQTRHRHNGQKPHRMAKPPGAAGQPAGKLGVLLGQLPGAVHFLLLPQGVVAAGVLPRGRYRPGILLILLPLSLDPHGGARVVLHMPEGIHAGVGADGHGRGGRAALGAFPAELALVAGTLCLALLQFGHFPGQSVAPIGRLDSLALLIHMDIALPRPVIPQGCLPFGDGRAFLLQGRSAPLTMGQGCAVPLAALRTLHSITPSET